MVYIFQWTKALGIRSFSSSLVPLFQNESSSKTFLKNMSLIWMKMNRSTFSNATRFNTEGKGHSEMAYCWSVSKQRVLDKNYCFPNRIVFCPSDLHIRLWCYFVVFR